MEKPLEGYRVVDMTHVLAGPYCTYQLGLLGARVTKVETLRGDMVRGWGGSEEELALGLGTGFTPQNAGKRSIAVDVASDAGREIVCSLIDRADIFVENFRPGSMAKLGLDYAAMRDRNPGLIYVSISAFGQDGPNGHRPGFDDVVQATSGYMSINVRGDGPIRTGGPVLDYATGMQAASATLAAVLQRARSGEGQRVDVAMQDVTMLLINRDTTIAANTGAPPARDANRDGPMLGRFATKDGYLMLAGYLPHHCRTLCRAIGLDQFAEASGRELAERSDALEQAVEAKLLERTSAEWDAIFSRAGVVGGGVSDLNAVLASGQPEARGLFAGVDTAAGRLQVTTGGYKLNGEVFGPAGPPPRLGEHTREVLEELGYDAGQIDELVDRSIVSD